MNAVLSLDEARTTLDLENWRALAALNARAAERALEARDRERARAVEAEMLLSEMTTAATQTDELLVGTKAELSRVREGLATLDGQIAADTAETVREVEELGAVLDGVVADVVTARAREREAKTDAAHVLGVLREVVEAWDDATSTALIGGPADLDKLYRALRRARLCLVEREEVSGG